MRTEIVRFIIFSLVGIVVTIGCLKCFVFQKEACRKFISSSCNGDIWSNSVVTFITLYAVFVAMLGKRKLGKPGFGVMIFFLLIFVVFSWFAWTDGQRPFIDNIHWVLGAILICGLTLFYICLAFMKNLHPLGIVLLILEISSAIGYALEHAKVYNIDEPTSPSPSPSPSEDEKPVMWYVYHYFQISMFLSLTLIPICFIKN